MSAPTATSKRSSATGRWGIRILFGALGALGIAAVAVWLTFTFGGVGGVELCPETFERRSFLYYEVPGTGWQVRKVVRIDQTGKTEEFLQTNNHIPKKAKGSAVWHIVQAQRGRRSWNGDAQILVNYFDAEDSYGNPVWLEWSSTNPKLAAALWPAISQLAMDELYIYMPEILSAAEGTKDAQDDKSFPTELNDRLGKVYHDAAVRCQQMENHQTAVEYLDQAIKYSPGNADYLKARAKFHDALGAADRAEADEARQSKK